MAAPGKPSSSSSASSSRWGSFLSQAVAGVESRLDNMLGEAEEAAAAAQAQGQRKTASTPPAVAKPSTGKPLRGPVRNASGAFSLQSCAANSRTSSSNRTNDRLQARLAKAMAAKAAQSGAASPRSSIDQASRSSADRPSMERPSLDKQSTDRLDVATGGAPDQEDAAPADKSLPGTPITESTSIADDAEASNPTPVDSPDPTKVKDAPIQDTASTDTKLEPETEIQEVKDVVEPGAQQDEPASQPIPVPVQPPPDTTPQEVPEATTDVLKLTQELEELKSQQQEEIQEYTERIDTLQAKLQYLSKNAADAAKKAASSAPSGSVERKLAEKDERIALLMEEGQRLSSTEQKYRTMLKKLRQQVVDAEKAAEESRKEKDKAASDAEALRSRLGGAEEKEKIQAEARRATAGLQKEIDALKKEVSSKDESLRRLEQEWKSKAGQAESASAEALKKALAAESDKQKQLEDAMATLRSEKDLQADKSRQEAVELREKLDRALERGRGVESELKLELRQLESKLEAMRIAAEEASSGSGGEAQVKLLRQMETLQTQYSTASENWQGIEASLLAKLTNLEKERDEAQRRESEMRKKARESASRCRHLEEQVQDLQTDLAAARQEVESCREQLTAVQTAAKATETSLQETRAALEKQQRSVSREDMVEAERRQWAEEVAGATHRSQSRPASPFFPIARTFSGDFNGLPVPISRPRRAPTPGSIPDAAAEVMSLGLGRRLSTQPLTRSIANSSSFNPPPSPFLPFESPSEHPTGPSPPAVDRDEAGEEPYLASPRQVAQDMISVSTVAAGPSVQLVERMSAAIRRLEAEKVAAKEEMARVQSQRDEARADMVGLMKELETAKAAPSRVRELEQEVANLNERYQTTLELLGEKSELVDELRADVQDVKAMYRELVERTVK
ncbi:hypothetical protein S7711_02390 [Stachybotrys chartarum IBT 7711]|uniref:TATA element modulatory factor 1 TATA binding domain-containing protein n=1 Tax=Stachybotrys chartarum (strain CBS 109288 / IBT 7711) TaxID=1280523 RepID=A0A084AQ91_STACB|nr:hypothetical protein S7711_02390 [Stachybotrys chartarum IBT 7711]